eukprot:2691487-Rhodomonas_salina.4
MVRGERAWSEGDPALSSAVVERWLGESLGHGSCCGRRSGSQAGALPSSQLLLPSFLDAALLLPLDFG